MANKLRFLITCIILECTFCDTYPDVNQNQRNYCGPGWFAFENKCYYFYKTKTDLKAARNLCSTMNSTLVSIHSSNESVFLNSVLLNEEAWIGLEQIAPSVAGFAWNDATVLNFTNWAPGAPRLWRNSDIGVYVKGIYWYDCWGTCLFSAVCQKVRITQDNKKLGIVTLNDMRDDIEKALADNELMHNALIELSMLVQEENKKVFRLTLLSTFCIIFSISSLILNVWHTRGHRRCNCDEITLTANQSA